jgi:hypothetical protein
MKRFLIGFVTLLSLANASRENALGGQVALDISYSGPNLGVAGSGVVQAVSAGGGEYEVVSGYINAVIPGVSGTVHETVVANLNFGTNQGYTPGTSVFENANGDEPTFDNIVFVPYNSPASTDGGQLTYVGGLMFQTAQPSTEDVYLSANSQGSFSGYYYFAGWNSQGVLGDGSLNTLSVTVAPSNDVGSASVPEPSSAISASIAAICLGLLGLIRKWRGAAV